MGMTIEESIENLVLIKKLEDGLGKINGFTNSVGSQALGIAIDTMRKYQKIEQMVAEIKQEHEDNFAREDFDTAYGLSRALDIIHKYTKEQTDGRND